MMQQPALPFLACLLAFAASVAMAQPDAALNPTASARRAPAAAPDELTYGTRVSRKIKEHTVYAGPLDLPGSHVVSFRVSLTPGGHVTALTTLRSSGVEEFGAAVAKGIIKASPLPVLDNGPILREVVIDFSMKGP